MTCPKQHQPPIPNFLAAGSPSCSELCQRRHQATIRPYDSPPPSPSHRKGKEVSLKWVITNVMPILWHPYLCLMYILLKISSAASHASQEGRNLNILFRLACNNPGENRAMCILKIRWNGRILTVSISNKFYH